MKKVLNLNLTGLKLLASDLARKYKQKDVVIGLVGELGAGKTAFTKAFASNFGIKKIKSPTFIIGARYPIQNRLLYHYDFYRLNKSSQLKSLDFNEILNSKNRILLIEWVDKFPNIQKKCDIILTFKVSGKNVRNVTIH
jgi:tRNA threonylcarbamoyladenosine biosynthesis protein TsaE